MNEVSITDKLFIMYYRHALQVIKKKLISNTVTVSDRKLMIVKKKKR